MIQKLLMTQNGWKRKLNTNLLEKKADELIDNAGIVCLCGSTKFKKEFEIATSILSKKGFIVLSVAQFSHHDNLPLTEFEKITFNKLHFKKIELADLVYIVNPNNYIGESTKDEIEYAKSLNKKIQYMF